ncbi:MAG: MBL fold metallo-hydrolase [Chthoniobacterales bacterium]|nr:MBL fold metallo-hydrolase [Chthoniobacterales bacterium]
MKAIERIAPDVGWQPISFVNAYFVGHSGGPWVLIDSGLPGRDEQIFQAAEARFGAGTRPEAIYLTHGHFDHAGSAQKLAEKWDVLIYAHRMELPYLTGRSDYPPPDPTMGGAMAFLSRFMPFRARDLSERVRELPDGELQGLPDWEWIATTGHSPGHVSFFRASDGVLLAGDAFATMNMDSWAGLVSGRQELARGGAPFNMDWDATRHSVQKLADLRPNVVGCGHGIPMRSADLPDRLERFAKRLPRPARGRYVNVPAKVSDAGVVSLPPAPFDPVPLATVGTLLLAGIALGSGYVEDQLRD